MYNILTVLYLEKCGLNLVVAYVIPWDITDPNLIKIVRTIFYIKLRPIFYSFVGQKGGFLPENSYSADIGRRESKQGICTHNILKLDCEESKEVLPTR